MSAKTYSALNRADALIKEIIRLLNSTQIDPDVQAALELELLSLRIQVEIARKETELNVLHSIGRIPTAPNVRDGDIISPV